MILAVLCIVLSFTACGNDGKESDGTESKTEKEAVPLVVIAGRHANAKMYTKETLEKYEDWFNEAVDVSGDGDSGYTGEVCIHLIVNDGYPSEAELISDGKNLTATIKKNNIRNLEKEIGNVFEKISEYLMSDEVMANDEETDLLSAICLAKRILLRDYPDANGRILILDSGISTAGYVRMQTEAQKIGKDTNVDEYINAIYEGAFMELGETVVAMEGLGTVGGLQEGTKDQAIQKNLEDYYTKLITERMGGILEGNIIYTEAPEGTVEMMAYEDGSGYPAVTPVLWETEHGSEAASAISLHTKTLDFKENSSEFNSKEKAVETISNYKEMLQKFAYNNQDKKIYVVGSIARDDTIIQNYPDGCRSHRHAEGRALATKDLLVEVCGLKEEQIVVIDAGATEFSWRNANEYPNGTDAGEDKDAQEKNRIVMIIPDDAENEACQNYLQELREKGYLE